MEVNEQTFNMPRDVPANEYGKGRESCFFETLADPRL